MYIAYQLPHLLIKIPQTNFCLHFNQRYKVFHNEVAYTQYSIDFRTFEANIEYSRSIPSGKSDHVTVM